MKTLSHNAIVLTFLLGSAGCGGASNSAPEPATPTTQTEQKALAEASVDDERPLDVELLRSSFKLVTEREPNLTSIFYDHLFTDFPDSKRMFEGVDLETQGEMLGAALTAVVEHLEDPEWLEETLGELGETHVGYGVEEEHYSWVGASLLKTLAQVAADDWNEELAQAWGDAYATIQSLMLAGADGS